MKYMSIRQNAFIFCSISMFFISLCSFSAFPQNNNEGEDEVGPLLIEFEQLSAKVSSRTDADAARGRYKEIQDRLISLGEAARPQIEARLEDRSNPQLRQGLTFILGEIPGEGADRTLFHLLCFDKSPGVGGAAMMQLVHRIDRYGPFTFSIPDEELEVLIEVVRKADMGRAGEVIRILGMCAQNDTDKRFDPILERFIRDVKYDGEFPDTMGAYCSPRVYMLNAYLLAFRGMGKTAWEPLRKAIQKAREEKYAEVEKWLCLSAGYAADPSVAEALKEVVLHDSDRYVRCVAIRAYAFSAKQAALPVLRTLVDDKTPSEYDTEGPYPYLIIGYTAEEQIRLLEKETHPQPVEK